MNKNKENTANLSAVQLNNWKNETIEMVLDQGYRAIPQYTGTSAKYADNQNYLLDARNGKVHKVM
jgi:hypothetical protein